MDSLRRRLDRSPHKSREDLARLDRLRKLRQLLDALQTLLARAHALESEALAVFYAREPMETEVIAAELAAIASERVLRSRDALRFSLAHPDDAVLAIFSEQRDWLLRLTSAYLATCVTLHALDYFTPPPKRTPESTAQRTAVPKVDKFFDDLPEYLLGVVFHLQGELLWPRIASEGGLHVFESGGKRQVCLVEVWDEGFADYQAPARIDRQGSIAALGAELRRTYRHDEGDVIDARRGKRPWSGERLASLLGVLFEEELRGVLDALTS